MDNNQHHFLQLNLIHFLQPVQSHYQQVVAILLVLVLFFSLTRVGIERQTFKNNEDFAKFSTHSFFTLLCIAKISRDSGAGEFIVTVDEGRSTVLERNNKTPRMHVLLICN
jgi:hypothetical protein